MTDLPLSERIEAPELRIPKNTSELTWRAATVADLDAMLDCAREIDRADHPHWATTREELEEEFEHSYVDATADSLLAIDAAGRVIAFGFTTLSPGQETLVRSILYGGVCPSLRGTGVGRQLLAWQHDRGIQQLASSHKTLPGWIVVFAEESETRSAALFARFGFEIRRYFLELSRDVSQPIADRPLDADLQLVPFSEEWSERTRLSRNNAFRDHWGSQPMNEEQWETFVARSVTRPDLSFLAIGKGAIGTDEVAGFVISSVNEEDWPDAGYSSAYIDLVGVAREWRGRGVAASLLVATLRAVADAGIERAVLDVDSDSPTGAVGLYTGVGFAESSRSMSFTREF